MAPFYCCCFIDRKPVAHSNSQTSFTNEVCVFSESARSEAVGMTRDVLLISFSVLLSIENVTSTFGSQGKCKE